MAYLLEKKRSALLVEGDEHGHLFPVVSRELWRWSWRAVKRSSALPIPKKKSRVTMVIFFHSSVEGCGGGLGISSREEEVCPSLLLRRREV